jgi:hypothetical protein
MADRFDLTTMLVKEALKSRDTGAYLVAYLATALEVEVLERALEVAQEYADGVSDGAQFDRLVSLVRERYPLKP